MIETICSTVFCLQSTLMPGQQPKINQNGDYVTLVSLTNKKYICSRIDQTYTCYPYQ